MGLELVEILMTVEDEFGVIIPEHERYETVAEFEDCIIRNLNPNQAQNALTDLMKFESMDVIPLEDYSVLTGKYPLLPSPAGFFKKKPYTPAEVIAVVKNQLSWSDDVTRVPARLREIIREALSVSAPIEGHHHLIKDLGIG